MPLAAKNIKQVKTLINNYFEVCDELQKAVGKQTGDTELNLREIATTEMLEYMEFLACGDGVISQMDAVLINSCLNRNYTTSDIAKMVKEDNVDSQTFELQPPVVLQFVTLLDAQKYNEFGNKATEESVTEIWYMVHSTIAHAFLTQFYVPDYRLKEYAKRYLLNMKDYISIALPFTPTYEREQDEWMD